MDWVPCKPYGCFPALCVQTSNSSKDSCTLPVPNCQIPSNAADKKEQNKPSGLIKLGFSFHHHSVPPLSTRQRFRSELRLEIIWFALLSKFYAEYKIFLKMLQTLPNIVSDLKSRRWRVDIRNLAPFSMYLNTVKFLWSSRCIVLYWDQQVQCFSNVKKQRLQCTKSHRLLALTETWG